jgi:predicted nucleic acid-binding Zn ribbon protein
MGEEQQPVETPRSSAPQEPPRQDDGLDLARAQTRATAGSTPAARRRRGKRTGRVTDSQVSGAHPDDRDPQLLGAMVDKLVGDQGWALELRVRGVFARWPELVGEEVAAHSTPETFADGKLVVRTDSTAWATQLKLLAPTVLRRLNEDLGEGTVTVLDVVGPHLPHWKKGRLSSRDGRGPRDTYG